MELAMIVFGALAMTVMGNKGLMGGSKTPEPLARPVPPSSEPSALRPPFQANVQQQQPTVQPQFRPTVQSVSQSVAQAQPTQSFTPSLPQPSLAMPEWARNALKETPTHFAQQKPTIERIETKEDLFPELARPLQIPMNPVSETRKLTLSPKSPKSVRRRQPTSEINLD